MLRPCHILVSLCMSMICLCVFHPSRIFTFSPLGLGLVVLAVLSQHLRTAKLLLPYSMPYLLPYPGSKANRQCGSWSPRKHRHVSLGPWFSMIRDNLEPAGQVSSNDKITNGPTDVSDQTKSLHSILHHLSVSFKMCRPMHAKLFPLAGVTDPRTAQAVTKWNEHEGKRFDPCGRTDLTENEGSAPSELCELLHHSLSTTSPNQALPSEALSAADLQVAAEATCCSCVEVEVASKPCVISALTICVGWSDSIGRSHHPLVPSPWVMNSMPSSDKRSIIILANRRLLATEDCKEESSKHAMCCVWSRQSRVCSNGKEGCCRTYSNLAKPRTPATMRLSKLNPTFVQRVSNKP